MTAPRAHQAALQVQHGFRQAARRIELTEPPVVASALAMALTSQATAVPSLASAPLASDALSWPVKVGVAAVEPLTESVSGAACRHQKRRKKAPGRWRTRWQPTKARRRGD